ncbi:molecular chaperone [Pantoea sp. SORGH_AS_0659]|uniref:fimbrial biogenesis chaperone n=1 Tax=Pantoea sp. SORGH_AS_0659 TaxID=3062597 RepID=UPI00285F3FD8|nr:molecular chaperone [Pantoea sp. SORGH_AS_0659]MDR6352453.1 P pilus assembly chaperone PapD [Pantoea sp. SORGH_AS_0659]
MRISSFILTALLFFTGLQTAFAGVMLSGTRLIYPESNREVSLTVRNPDKSTDYLIQSWLENNDKSSDAKVPFVITPPLFRLDRDTDNILRIANTGGNLPSDREALYWLNVRAIGATPKGQAVNRLQLVQRTRIKFIYRPASLNKNEAADAYKSLTFTQLGKDLVVKNPTPYYVSFASLKVGGKDVPEPGMVAPRSELRLSAPGSGTIEWQAINDYGGKTPAARQ